LISVINSVEQMAINRPLPQTVLTDWKEKK